MDLIMTSREKKGIDNMRALIKMMSEKDEQFVDGFFKCAELLLPHIQDNHRREWMKEIKDNVLNRVHYGS